MGGVHIEKGGQLLIQNWKFQRGDIFFTRFDNATGSEQSGNRPAVVLQNDVGNFYSPTLIRSHIDKQVSKKVHPADPLPAGERFSLRSVHRSGRADLYHRQKQGAEIPRTPHPGGNEPGG